MMGFEDILAISNSIAYLLVCLTISLEKYKNMSSVFPLWLDVTDSERLCKINVLLFFLTNIVLPLDTLAA